MLRKIWKNGQKVGEWDDGQEEPKCLQCGTELEYYSATACYVGYCPHCHNWKRHD